MSPLSEFNRRHAGFWELSGKPNYAGLYALRDLKGGRDTGAWASAGAAIGQDVSIGPGVSIGQDVSIWPGVSIAQGVSIARGVYIARGARIGQDAAPRPGSRCDVFVLHPVGSAGGTLTAYRNRDGGVSVTRGCFCGTLDEFAAAVEKTHGDNEYGREYRAVIALLRVRYAELLGADA